MKTLPHVDLLHVTNRLGSTPFRVACQNGHISVVSLLLEMDASDDTLLHVACEHGQLSVVSLLLEKRPQLFHALRRWGDSASCGMQQWSRCCCFYSSGERSDHDFRLIRASTHHGHTALSMTCCNYRLGALSSSVVSLLVETDPVQLQRMPTKYGRTPLITAISYRQIDATCALLAMDPSFANLQRALGCRDQGLVEVVSQLPVVEWQRQLGLQDEFLYVQYVLSVVMELTQDENEDAVLVLRGAVERNTQLLFQRSQLHYGAIPQRSLEWHERKCREKFM